MKSITTLVSDIEKVVKTKGGWTEAINAEFLSSMEAVVKRRFATPEEEREPTLRMSNIGTPCRRKLWYYLNKTPTTEGFGPQTLMKFAYGDILETVLISLAKAAGHTVEGEQTEVNVGGIIGHRDCVIDGVTVDVKTASPQGMAKFIKNGLRKNDPFGYIDQLTGYVLGGKDDPLVKDKKGGAFLVINKVSGEIVLDYYDLSLDLPLLPTKVDITKLLSTGTKEPLRSFTDTPDGKSGNMKLGPTCSYCDYKWVCWPGLEGYAYAGKPTFLTKVVRTPNVPPLR